MNPDLIKTIGITIGAIASAPLVALCVKGALFFGSMSETVKTMSKFVEHATSKLDNHETRLTTIEAERRTEAEMSRRHWARRAGDPPAVDGEAS